MNICNDRPSGNDTGPSGVAAEPQPADANAGSTAKSSESQTARPPLIYAAAIRASESSWPRLFPPL